jgi:hypothetical protein
MKTSKHIDKNKNEEKIKPLFLFFKAWRTVKKMIPIQNSPEILHPTRIGSTLNLEPSLNGKS